MVVLVLPLPAAPVRNKEGLIIETLDFNRVLKERQNFGHYSRLDITKLNANRER